jgi:hypothetical protein
MHRLRFRPLLVGALALAAAACTDRANPLAPGQRPGGSGPPGTPITVQALQCEASREQLRVRCEPLKPGEGDARGDIIVGSQGVFVQVTTSNVNYNSGTGQFTFDATLQNLIQQPMGTTDGTTLDPNGIRIFFHSGPSVTTGTGVASVVPDGFGTFTAAGQPYYQYNQVLASSVTSSARTWTLVMPPTVLTFSFLLFVSAPVEYPNGYVDMDGQLPGASFGALHPGDTHQIVATAKTAVGVPTGAAVTFSATDPTCATVSPTGLVTGVQYATCAINATSGALAGDLSFDVTGTERSWTGATSADWNVGSNWAGGLVPATADSVNIPFGVPNYPALSGAVTVMRVLVADNATLSLGAFNLTANEDVGTGSTGGSGILATGGVLVLNGAGCTLHGRIPAFLVTNEIVLDGDVVAVAPGQVDLGNVVNTGFNLQVVSQ